MSLIPWIDRNTLFPSLTFPQLSDHNFGDGDFFDTRWFGRELTVPAVNINQTKQAFEIEVAAPGMRKKDFKVEVKNGDLIISAGAKTEKEEKKEDYAHREFSYNSFCRSFHLPDNVNSDKIKANYTDGILKITVPKAKAFKDEPAKQVAIS